MYVSINPELHDARGSVAIFRYCQQAFHPDSVQMGVRTVEHLV